MGIKFEYGGIPFEADTPEQIVQLLDLLALRDSRFQDPRFVAGVKGAVVNSVVAGLIGVSPDGPKTPWNVARFSSFVERLGDRQKLILEFLIIRRKASDEELRSAVQAADNHVLAGVLSGITKHALAENIDPRDIFWVKNLRSAGRRSNRYEIADVFLRIAREMNWPPLHHPEIFPELSKT